MIPYDRYPGLAPLFGEFLRGVPDLYPDRPTLDAAAARGRELLASGARARVPAAAFRHRGPDAARMAADLAEGRAVAVSTGQQVGLFTGPLFTLVKAFDAIRLARALSERGVPAVPVFWALTDDHDLQEVARTARPTPEGAEILVLEGADRQNRQPVGRLPIPEGIGAILEAFRSDAKAEGAAAILDAFARRSAPGVSYGDAFIETLLDLVDPDPLLVLEPFHQALRAPTVAFFLEAAKKAEAVREALTATEAALRASGRDVPAPLPEGFSFFEIDESGRRRIQDLPGAVARAEAGRMLPSGDVVTRPVLKSYLIPMAASVLGAGEIAYHAQSLPLYPLLGVPRPVLLPRTHLVLRGPVERRLADALGLPEQDLLAPPPGGRESAAVPQAEALARIARETGEALAVLAPDLRQLDPTLSAALDTAGRKIAYQLDHLGERARKSAERRDDVTTGRRKRLQALLAPGGIPAERVFPPLSTMLAWGDGVRDRIRRAAGDPAAAAAGAVVLDLGIPEDGGADGR